MMNWECVTQTQARAGPESSLGSNQAEQNLLFGVEGHKDRGILAKHMEAWQKDHFP